MIVLILLCCVISAIETQKSRRMKHAVKVFQELRPVYINSGVSPEEVDGRLDNFVRNYLRLQDLEAIKGKTFKAKLNSIELLSDEEVEKLFGLEPRFNKEEPDVQVPEDDEILEERDMDALVQQYGLKLVREALLVFTALRPQFKSHNITAENQKTRLLSFTERFLTFHGDKNIPSLQESLADPTIVDFLTASSPHRRQKRFVMNENHRETMPATPNPARGKPFENNADYNNLGAFLNEALYDEEVVRECEELAANKSLQVARSCLGSAKPGCADVQRRCLNSTYGVPDLFNDWENLGYTRSLLHYRVGNTLPASWAHAATQTMDLYQQIYAKNITYYRRDLIDLFQVLSCTYKNSISGLSRGSPQAAFSVMAASIVVPKFGDKFPVNCRDEEECKDNDYLAALQETMLPKSEGAFYKFYYLWEKAKVGRDDSVCHDSDTYEPENTSIKNVSFAIGKAYVQFGDDSSEDVWVMAESGNYVKTTVYGENIAKPMIYKKGPITAMMKACYEIFLIDDGIFNYNCEESDRRYLAQWVVIASYGPNWFGTIIPQIRAAKTFGVAFPSVIKVSRAHQYTFNWNSFVVPRVSKYSNTMECANGGLTYVEEHCYCKKGYAGHNCTTPCDIECKNGGSLSHHGCECSCPSSHWGTQCEDKCECGDHGRCNEEGHCICNRQMSYGEHCQNKCMCKNKGVCHADGSCECLAGFSGTTCTQTCDKKCTWPEVCRYSNLPTDSNDRMAEVCACPYGFYGSQCNQRIDCRSHHEENEEVLDICAGIIKRNRCNTNGAIQLCPKSCGHCAELLEIGEESHGHK